jgi:hypothetical protein
MQKKIKITDAMIRRAMVELGWLFPVTEQEVKWAEEKMRREGFNPDLPEELKEPPFHLLPK